MVRVIMPEQALVSVMKADKAKNVFKVEEAKHTALPKLVKLSKIKSLMLPAAKRPYIRMTKEVIDTIIRLWKEKKSYTEIADEVGLNRNKVAGVVYRNKTKPRYRDSACLLPK